MPTQARGRQRGSSFVATWLTGGRGVIVVVALAALALVAGLMWQNREDDSSIPSFDEPLGALDYSKVPGGWGPAVDAAAKKAGIPGPVLAAQLETESHWDPKAKSSAGAEGLAQFTPDAWAEYGQGGDPYKPQDAIAAQGRLMAKQMARLKAANLPDNRIKLALAAYNAGYGNVTKYGGVPPFPETTEYVKKVAQRKGYYAKPIVVSPSTSASSSAN